MIQQQAVRKLRSRWTGEDACPYIACYIVEMLLQAAVLVSSLILLYFGAEWLVRGSARIAAHFGVTPLVVGLVIVGFGTSTPEVVVSGLASFHGHSETALGNVIGSNIANSGLILALATLIRPMKSDLGLLRREGPFMVVLTLVFWAIAWSGGYNRMVGVLAITVLALFVMFTLRWARAEHGKLQAEFAAFEKEENITPAGPVWRNVVLALVGIALLLAGGQLLVNAAVAIARHFGVSELVIAVTLISIGTSVPELATSVVAALRGEGDIAIGNVIGSNTFNLLGVLGISAAIRPIAVRASVRNFDMVWLLVFATATFLFLRTGRRLARWEGGVLLAAYAAYVWLVVQR